MAKLHVRFSKDYLAILVLLVIVLVFLRRGVLGEGIFFSADEISADSLHGAYVYHEFFAKEYLRHGKIPLWNPYISSGVPVLGEAQTGVFNPISSILYFFLSPKAANNWQIILTFILIAVGTYVYCRSISLSSESAFLAALVFSLSGFFIGHVKHIQMIFGLAFMPFAFFVCEKIIRKKNLIWSALLSLLIFLSFSAGHLTITYSLILLLIVYFLTRFLFQRGEYSEDLVPFILFFVAIFLGVILSACVILPAVELASYSTRASLRLEDALSPPYKFKYFAQFLDPYIFGDPSRGTWDMFRESFWENIGYVGILPLLLAIFAILVGQVRKNKYVLSFIVVLLFGLLLLLGNYLFFYRWVRDWIPGFSFTRIPGRFLLYVDFALAILCAFGFSHFVGRLKSRKTFITFIIIAFCVADLFEFGYNFNTVIPNDYYKEPQTVKFLQSDPDLFRIRPIFFEATWQKVWEDARGWREDLSGYMAQRDVLPPDSSLMYRLYSTTFLNGMSGHLGVHRSSHLDWVVARNFDAEDRSRIGVLLGVLNVKYLLSQVMLPDTDSLELVAKIPSDKVDISTFIYKNNKWLPRAYFVPKALYVDSKNVLNVMFSDSFDPKREVIIEKNLVGNLETGGSGEVKITSYSDEKVSMDVESQGGGFLVLSDTNYPGWKADIDGKSAEILTANYAYRTVYVYGGVHHVTFSYEPQSVRMGELISLGGFLAIFATFAVYLLHYRRVLKFP